MTGLPKKYARMGFKKGWRAFKASKNKRKTRSVKKRGVSTMARRRRKTRRRRVTRRLKRRSSRRSGSVLGMPFRQIIDPAIVGLVSGPMDHFVDRGLALLPFSMGGVPRPLVQATGGVLLAKFIPNLGKLPVKRYLKKYAEYKIFEASRNASSGFTGMLTGTGNGGGW